MSDKLRETASAPPTGSATAGSAYGVLDQTYAECAECRCPPNCVCCTPERCRCIELEPVVRAERSREAERPIPESKLPFDNKRGWSRYIGYDGLLWVPEGEAEERLVRVVEDG